jgi:hypothetical protein
MALLKTDVWASPKWTKVKPKVYNDLVYKVGALDMAALVIAPWALDWIWPVESNQSIIKQGRGSGLGQKITIKSHRAGRGMYLTAHSLVRHREPESVMHPGTRRATEVDFIDD